MSIWHLELMTAAFVVLNIILIFAAIKLGRAQTTPSLDELMKTVADAAGARTDEE